MDIMDVISFTVSVSLGIISIALGIFAIWLSYKLSQSSTSALESVKDLTREAKILVDASLSQHKDFSTKMLDSILDKNKFGSSEDKDALDSPIESTTVLTAAVEKILVEFEQKISASIEKTVQEFASTNPGGQVELREALVAIKDDIGKLSQAAPVISSAVKESEDLRQNLQSFREHPAHYVVLYGIVRSGLRNYKDGEQVAIEYDFPVSWEDGVENLISKGVLESTGEDQFDIPEGYKELLHDWADRNKKQISKLRAMYRRRKAGENGPTPAEVLVGSNFEH